MTCETCGLPTYDWGNCAPQGGSCRDCGIGICARPECAAQPVEVCCDECAPRGLCFECASLRWAPEFPAAILAANRAEVDPNQILKSLDAAREVGVTYAAVAKWCRTGQIRGAFRPGRGHWRFSRAAFDAFLSSRKAA